MTNKGRLFLTALVIIVFGTLTAAIAQDERFMGGRGITVFRDRDFKGASATYQNDMPNLGSTEFNDRIRSIRIGRGEQWEICEHANYQGRCVIVSGEESDLRQNDWDNKISSFRRAGGGRPGPGPDNGYIVIYTEKNYRGTPTNYNQPQSNLFAMNNKAQSVTISRGEWQLCDGIGFGGKCVTLTRSVSDLGSVGMKKKVRSVRPVGYQGPPPDANWYIVLFEEQNFRGNPTNYNTERTNINKRARSITIGAGVWEICDGRNFTGRCQTLTESASDLTRYNIGYIIRSVRPMRPQPR